MKNILQPMLGVQLKRRRFVTGLAMGGVMAGFGLPAGRLIAAPGVSAGQAPMLEGPMFDLAIGEQVVNFTGAPRVATTVNGSLPAPTLRFKEGQRVTLKVANRLAADSSIHWHGMILPTGMDGVPGLSFAGIKPGESFTYSFDVRQSGTYWYHSHSGFQEQTGLYGAIIIDPKEPDPFSYDRDYVVMLSDWSDEDPHAVYAKLKKLSHYYNFNERTLADTWRDIKAQGVQATFAAREMWNQMRMSESDISDVTGYTYSFLMNGQTPAEGWKGLFKRGEKVRLRFINGSAMTFFDVRIPGLKMTVVAADGQYVEPVSVDEFRIGVAETYDVIVEPQSDQAYSLFAQAIDRSGYARGTLTPDYSMTAEVPALDPVPLLTHTDMGMGGMDHSMHGMGGASAEMPMQKMSSSGMNGMDHSMHNMGTPNAEMSMENMQLSDDLSMADMRLSGEKSARGTDTMADQMKAGMQENMQPSTGGMDHSSMNHSSMNHSSMNHSSMNHSSMDHSGMNHSMGGMNHAMGDMTGDSSIQHVATEYGPHVDMRASNPQSRLDDPGVGLRNNGRRVLTYADLRNLYPTQDTREPGREINLHLTGNMSRYMWSINGVKFSDAEPIKLKYGERVRINFVNDTMMNHPMHLHGMWSELETGDSRYLPRKHTVVVQPGAKISYLVTADALGQWAFHCHLLFHMPGMFRAVHVS